MQQSRTFSCSIVTVTSRAGASVTIPPINVVQQSRQFGASGRPLSRVPFSPVIRSAGGVFQHQNTVWQSRTFCTFNHFRSSFTIPPRTPPNSRWFSSSSQYKTQVKGSAIPWYGATVGLFMFAGAFAAVPLYQVFCQTTGYGGTTQEAVQYKAPPETDTKASKRLLQIDFAATVDANLPWEFVPVQSKLTVAPGETALAFYQAKNLTDKPIIGMAVYHVMPPEVGIYFNKIQCFCFEEQMLNPHEEVDMPVFFFIDPDFADDPRLQTIDRITLSYIFFESASDIPEQYKDLQIARPTDKIPKVVEA
eukprot:GDKI01030825.1.p1 GENE.GDKI01030825.1~~GDKI01030825.1.p1  ORF type:complete len:306 (+),score=34.90 GDKI01030825.1:120-1037(+)